LLRGCSLLFWPLVLILSLWICKSHGGLLLETQYLDSFRISPDRNTFLTTEQTALVKQRIETDRGDSEFDALTWKKFLIYTQDLKLWGFALCFMCSTTASYAINFFLPTILRGMHYSVKDSQLLVSSTSFSKRWFADYQ